MKLVDLVLEKIFLVLQKLFTIRSASRTRGVKSHTHDIDPAGVRFRQFPVSLALLCRRAHPPQSPGENEETRDVQPNLKSHQRHRT